jgi:hypothetical protein
MDVEQTVPSQSEESPIPVQPEESPAPVQPEGPPIPVQAGKSPALAQSEESPAPIQPEETQNPVQAEESPAPIQPEEPPIPEPSSILASYSLRFTGGPSTGQLVAIAVAAGVYTALSWFCSTYLTSVIPGVSVLFVAIGFGIPFAIWFGGWAFVIGYIGNVVGAGILLGFPLSTDLWFGTVDLIQLGLPMLLYRLLARRVGVDPIGKDVFTLRGFIFFLLCAVLPGNIIGGAYGNAILIWTGVVPPSSYYLGWFTWTISNIVFSITIGSILLKNLGSVVERFGLTVRNALN